MDEQALEMLQGSDLALKLVDLGLCRGHFVMALHQQWAEVFKLALDVESGNRLPPGGIGVGISEQPTTGWNVQPDSRQSAEVDEVLGALVLGFVFLTRFQVD